MVSASSPGKVLICGGYLVVEAPNVGLSLGVTARFTTKVIEDTVTSEPSLLRLVVQSPQFGSSFTFDVTYNNETKEVAVKQTSGSDSPFLYFGIMYSIASVVLLKGWEHVSGRQITVVLLASNDFYSQRKYLEQIGEEVTTEALRKVPAHQPLVGEVSKTGLGSSAAMTSSFVACLHALFIGKDAIDVERVHRVAQVAHSVAQGKIGSGFDVYTGIYGTSIYCRFPAERATMMMGNEHPTAVHTAVLDNCIDGTQTWVKPTVFHRLPRGITMMLADIHQGGSSTPGMVASVFKWRKSVQGVAGNLWDQLSAANVAYIECLQKLQEQATKLPTEHDAAVQRLSQHVLTDEGAAGEKDAAAALWWEARTAAGTCRKFLRDVGTAAEVTIEPVELTPLLDATLQLPGVLAAGCPGAGGYDAIFALVLGDVSTAVEKFWESYQGLHVCPLLVREDPAGLTFD